MKDAILITCFSLSEAHLVKHKLDNAGIYCYLSNELMTELDEVSVHVREEDRERAIQVIDKKEKED